MYINILKYLRKRKSALNKSNPLDIISTQMRCLTYQQLINILNQPIEDEGILEY